MSLIPSFADAPSPYGSSGLGGSGAWVPPSPATPTRSSTAARRLPTIPSPRSGNGATPDRRAHLSLRARALPFAFDVSVLDLSGLGFQHSPGLGAPAAGITGVRPFDPYAIRRDFPILQQNVNGRPLVWLDNAATTQKPQSGDRSPRRTSTSTRTRTSTAPPTRWRRASTDAYEAARDKVRALHQRAVAGEHHLRARHDRGHQPHRQGVGRPQRQARATRSSSRISSTTPTSCPGSSSPPRRAPS